MWKNYPTRWLFCLFLLFATSTLIKGVRRPRFLRSGYITLPRLTNASYSLNISLKIYPELLNGLLLYSGRLHNGRSDFFSITLNDGYVIFRFDCGSGVGELRTPERVQLGVNNTITVSRVNNSADLILNGGDLVTGVAPGNAVKITFNVNLFLGGHSDMCRISPRVGTSFQFEGCVQELIINDHNYNLLPSSTGGEILFETKVGDCLQSQCDLLNCSGAGECIEDGCMCPYGYTSNNCSDSAYSIRIPRWDGTAYIALPVLQNSEEHFTITLKFIAFESNGLLLYSGQFPNEGPDFFSLSLQNRRVVFRYNCGSGLMHVPSDPIQMDREITVSVNRTGRRVRFEINPINQVLEADSPGHLTGITLQTYLYVGGHPNVTTISSRAHTNSFFDGYIDALRINQHLYDLQDDSLEIESQENVGDFSIYCINTVCSNGGRCIINASYEAFCLCPEGYSGSRCEDGSN